MYTALRHPDRSPPRQAAAARHAARARMPLLLLLELGKLRGDCGLIDSDAGRPVRIPAEGFFSRLFRGFQEQLFHLFHVVHLLWLIISYHTTKTPWFSIALTKMLIICAKMQEIPV